MSITNIIFNPFFMLFLLLIISTVIYYVVSNNTTIAKNNDCKPDEDLLDSGCYKKCQDDDKRCGTQCYNTAQFACMTGTNSICELEYKYCPKKDGSQLCCDDQHYCDKTTNTCVLGCPPGQVRCGKDCCNKADCQGEGETGICCPTARYCKVSGRISETVCCTDACCNGICCGTDESCVGGECKTKCGTLPPCDPDTQICVEDETDINNITYTCMDRGSCVWGDVAYTPQMIEGDTKSQYPVCERTDNTFWLIPNTTVTANWMYGNKVNMVNVPLDTNTSKPECKGDIIKQSCSIKIGNSGTNKIDLSKYPNLFYDTITTNCSANLDCNKYLADPKNLQNICSDINKNRPYTCCVGGDNKTYTGQVCTGDTDCSTGSCMCNKSGFAGPTCNYSSNDCSNHGYPTYTNGTMVCICNEGTLTTPQDKLTQDNFTTLVLNFNPLDYYTPNPTGGCIPMKWYEFYNPGRVKNHVYNWLKTLIRPQGYADDITVNQFITTESQNGEIRYDPESGSRINVPLTDTAGNPVGVVGGWKTLILLQVNWLPNFVGGYTITDASGYGDYLDCDTNGNVRKKYTNQSGEQVDIYAQIPYSIMRVYGAPSGVDDIFFIMNGSQKVGVHWNSATDIRIADSSEPSGELMYYAINSGWDSLGLLSGIPDFGWAGPGELSGGPAIFVFNNGSGQGIQTVPISSPKMALSPPS